MELIRLAAHLFILMGAVNTGVLTSGDKALLFDCCDTVTPDRLKGYGINQVEFILCTQHKRTNVAGIYSFEEMSGGSLNTVVPADERDMFDKVDEYWNSWKSRWYIAKPMTEILPAPIPVRRTVREGDVINWEGYQIHVLDTPGATNGAVSYLVTVDGKTFCFSGDAIYGPGKIWDIYSLQHGYDFGSPPDYHGFMGNLRKLIPSLKKLGSCGASALIPSHGTVIDNPFEATQLTIAHLEKAYRNYCSISSIRYYFPNAMAEGENDPDRMLFAPVQAKINFISQIPNTTTFVVKSASGAALVIDCWNERVINELRRMLRGDEISSVEGVWVTHYHTDHVDGITQIYNTFRCPIITDEHVAEVIAHPRNYLLPYVSPNIVPVTRITKHGETWNWREFKLTAYHFPGQSLYHSGLFVEGRGKRIFLGGDSFSPAGIDDYCPGNRNFLGRGRGFDFCLDLIKGLKPDGIINPHQDLPIHFTDGQIDYMKKVLAEREQIFGELLPWENQNFGTDVAWARAYPYEQDVVRGAVFSIEVRFTNHANLQANAKIEPVLPEGWIWQNTGSSTSTIAPLQDGGICSTLTIPKNARPGQYVIPFRIIWNGRYLGQFRNAVVYVM